MNMATAHESLTVPANVANSNVVIDGQKRLKEVLNLADRFYKPTDSAPGYVVTAVENLQSWINYVSQGK
jgi:hypothetical protein